LVLHAGKVKGKRVLDLCAGNMRATKCAIDNGASSVMSVDVSAEMMGARKGGSSGNKEVYISDISHWVPWSLPLGAGRFDLAVCQQGVNFWWSKDAVASVAKMIAPRGHFVFNTFLSLPDSVPMVRKYTLDGLEYMETSWSVGHKVMHVQICGDLSHLSSFEWLPVSKIADMLKPHFVNIDFHYDGSTVIVDARKGK